ncbi:MAG: peptidyl-prolyl cis-trans isomerase [Candidatus Electrothrix sp. AR4]|nr:peptidyl-prolyl cis-trans isomerase [Candidatus Electrothrix sp. AR4]
MKLLITGAVILLCSGALFFAYSFYRDAPEKNGGSLAEINGAIITDYAFREEMQHRMGDYTTLEKRSELLDEMVQFEVRYAAAVQKGIDKDPKVVEAFRRMVVNRYLQQYLTPRLEESSVTETEISTYYTNHLDQFLSPEMVRVAVIKISVPTNVSEEKKEQLLQKAHKARDEAIALSADVTAFGRVAVTYSDDQVSRYRGGDSGWLNMNAPEQKWEQGVINHISSLKNPGDISPVIQGKEGFYLLKLMEVRKSVPLPFEQVKDKIGYRLVQEQKQQIADVFFREAKKRIDVSVDYEAMKHVESPVRKQQVSQKDQKTIPPMPKS